MKVAFRVLALSLSTAVLGLPNRQVPFLTTLDVSSPSAPQHVRLEITSPSPHGLSRCGPNLFHSGYARFANETAGMREDKHLFFAYFEANENPEDKPLLITFGGGPGSSGLANPMLGMGPCTITAPNQLSPSSYPWTNAFNLIALDYPVGVGYSYAEQWALRNTSESAAWDADDFLQAFLGKFPKLAKNNVLLFSGSYGGIYVPNLAKVIHTRNHSPAFAKTRIPIHLESVVMSNACSDRLAQMRWLPSVTCSYQGDDAHLNVLNATGCNIQARGLPACEDAIELAYSEYGNTLENRLATYEACDDLIPVEHLQRNFYDRRIECKGLECVELDPVVKEFPHLAWYEPLMNSTTMRKTFGVPSSLQYKFVNIENVSLPFTNNGDLVQNAAKLLEEPVRNGLRVMVINGIQDSACHHAGDLSWFSRLDTPHRTPFNVAPEKNLPSRIGNGTIQQVGRGAGAWNFVKMTDAGHFVEDAQPAMMYALMSHWVNNETFFPDTLGK